MQAGANPCRAPYGRVDPYPCLKMTDVTNTLAYYGTELMTAVKSFNVGNMVKLLN